MVHFACGDAMSAKRLETFDVVADVASARARRFRGGVRGARAPLQVWKSRFGGYAWAGARQGAFAHVFRDLNGVSSAFDVVVRPRGEGLEKRPPTLRCPGRPGPRTSVWRPVRSGRLQTSRPFRRPGWQRRGSLGRQRPKVHLRSTAATRRSTGSARAARPPASDTVHRSPSAVKTTVWSWTDG